MQPRNNRSLSCLAIAALAAIQLGCLSSAPPKNTTQTMRASASVPAGKGTVKAVKTDNGNTALTVSVEHLAPPAMVAADATTYVVWIQPKDAAIQSVGAIALNDNLEGRLSTITAHSRFTVTVTPEANAHVSQPVHKPVLISEVVRHD